MIILRVPAVPVSQPRPRAVNIRGQSRMISAPAKHPVVAFKATVRLAAAAEYTSGAPLEGPLSVAVEFIMPRPKSKIWKTKPMPRYPYTGRSDIDNLAKSVLDALNGLSWRDDSQIAELYLCAYVAAGDETPHCVVFIDKILADSIDSFFHDGTDAGNHGGWQIKTDAARMLNRQST